MSNETPEETPEQTLSRGPNINILNTAWLLGTLAAAGATYPLAVYEQPLVATFAAAAGTASAFLIGRVATVRYYERRVGTLDEIEAEQKETKELLEHITETKKKYLTRKEMASSLPSDPPAPTAL